MYGSKLSNQHRGLKALIIFVVIAATIITLLWLIVYVTKGFGSYVGSADTIKREVVEVTITAKGLYPANISISAGQQVRFVNQDTKPHRLLADAQYLDSFDSERLLTTGDSYTYVFDTPGKYTYYDSENPSSISGAVEVRNK